VLLWWGLCTGVECLVELGEAIVRGAVRAIEARYVTLALQVIGDVGVGVDRLGLVGGPRRGHVLSIRWGCECKRLRDGI